MTQTTVSPARRAETAAQLRRGRILRTVRSILRHLLLALLAAIWLVPILWLLVTSFSTDRGINVRQFFPASYTLRNYVNILFHPDSVAQFPRWFTNTLVVACFNCVISTCFVLMVAYALSCCRFKGRKLIQNLSVSVNLFPGVLAMIAVYFVLKYLNLTNSYAGLIMVYAGSSGLGYLICKGFFDTIPISLREAAKLDGASDARVFFQVVLPMSKPILVYTIISSFMVPWTDFVMAKMILNSGVSADWTVAIGLYNMLQKTLINNYFALFCAGGVLVSIPISILFVIMQKFYVEGITSGADKGYHVILFLLHHKSNPYSPFCGCGDCFFSMAAGKQFVQGEPHFYIKRCLFGCPEPCHKTGIEQLTYLMFIRSLDEKELATEEFESMAGEKMEHLFPASAAGQSMRWSKFKDKDSREIFLTMQQRVFPAIKKMKYGRLPDFDENGELMETIDAVRENAVHVTA